MPRMLLLFCYALFVQSEYSLEDKDADHTDAAIEKDEAGDAAGAAASFRAHVKFHPEDGAGWGNLATALAESGGSEEEIEECLSKASELVPYSVDDEEADHWGHAIEMEEAGDKEAALNSFRAHTKFNPEDVPGWKNFQAALEGVEGDKAREERGLCERKIRYWGHMQNLDVGPGGVQYNLEDENADHIEQGITKAEEGDKDAAILSFRAAIKHQPSDEYGWRNLAAALEEQLEDSSNSNSADRDESELEQLQSDLNLCLEKIDILHPYDVNDIDADHTARAIVADERGDMESAIASFRAHIKFHPDDSAGWNNLAAALEGDDSSKHATEVQECRSKAEALDGDGSGDPTGDEL